MYKLKRDSIEDDTREKKHGDLWVKRRKGGESQGGHR